MESSRYDAATPVPVRAMAKRVSTSISLGATMGIMIVAQRLTIVAVAVALWRQPFADEALGWALRFGITIAGAVRRRPDAERVRLTFAFAASYLSLFAILLSQAMCGQSVLKPDTPTTAVLTAWLLLTLALTSLTARCGDTVAAAAV
jgi:hypothetical protein